jgi:hypothetical protein
MKLNLRLDLNTIVLLLLIVVFSTILYYNFKRDRIIEGNTGTFEANKAEYTSKNTTLTLYKNTQSVYNAAWSEYTRQKGILSKLKGEYQSLVSTVNANNSAAIARLFPNTNDIKYKVDELTNIFDNKIGELNTIHSSIYADITNFNAISQTSTQNIFNRNNTKITNKISEIIKSIADLKKTILASLNFTITSIVAGDGNVTITIGSATDATATRYNIKATDTSGKTIDGTPPIVSPYVFNGLTNDIPYTFRVTADYGKLSDGTPLTATVTSTAVTPRAKPSFTVTMGTSSATVNIVPTPGNKMYTISVTSSTGVTKTLPVNATTNTSIPDLENDTLYAFKVIADYGNSTLLESDTKTGTPRAPPTLSIKGGDSLAMLTITAPNTTDKPTKYIISATPAGVAEKTVLDISSPIPFTGLANGKTYKFSVVAVYSDGTKSSPATIQVTPKVRPSAGIIATSGNKTVTITIVPPKTNLPSSIMNYLVTSRPPSTTKTIGASDRTTTISGLTNGTSYKFSVVVKYADGTSSVSKESSSVTPTLPAPTVATRATLPAPTVATRATLPAPPVATRATLPAPPVATTATLTAPTVATTAPTVAIPAPPVATRATLPAPPVATRATLPAPTVATTAPTVATTAPTVTITATAGSNKATINIARSSSTTTRTISKYEITSIPYITPIIVSTVPVNYSRDITGLTKMKKYKFTVKAFYSGGTVSAISNEITVK